MVPSSTTSSGHSGVNQFSIFLRNKVGALLEVVKLLNHNHVHVLAMAIEACADTAIVRIVVSDPESVTDLFHLNQIPFSVWPLLVVELREADQLGALLSALLAAEVNIFGSYALLTQPQGHSALAVHVEDNECATAVLTSAGFKLLDQIDLSR